MLEKYNLKMPHAVYSGENAMDNVTDIIRARGAKKVAIFTDKGIDLCLDCAVDFVKLFKFVFFHVLGTTDLLSYRKFKQIF